MDKRVYDNGHRTLPAAGGIHGNQLMPSIGTDRWATRVEDSGQTFTGGSCFKARPIAGHVPGAKADPAEVSLMALDQAAKLCKTSREDRMVQDARLTAQARGANRSLMLSHARMEIDGFEALSLRCEVIGGLIREALNL